MPSQTKSDDKVEYFGVETPLTLTFRNYKPGFEYTQLLTLKNIKFKSTKLKYSCPTSGFFNTLYPKSILLSAGTQFQLPITFKPTKLKEYQDTVEFTAPEGKFTVVLKAELPKHDISLPEKVDVPVCCVHHGTKASFKIKNTGDAPTQYSLEGDDPFVLTPLTGTIKPQQSEEITIEFHPKEAGRFVGNLTCRFGESLAFYKTFAVESVSKFPHLIVQGDLTDDMSVLEEAGVHALVNFDGVYLGQSVERSFLVENVSDVDVLFAVHFDKTVTTKGRRPFELSVKGGTIPPHASVNVKVRYSPQYSGSADCEFVSVAAAGDLSLSTVKLTGNSRGPSVFLSENRIGFSLVDLGQVVRRPISLINDSDSPAHYQFALDSSYSVFSVDHADGVLEAHSKLKLVVSFSPQQAMTYFRRVTCIVHNQEPLFLDLLATCHSETVQPPVVEWRHLARFQKHWQRGLSLFPPETLRAMMQQKKLEADANGDLQYAQAESVEPYCEPVEPFPPFVSLLNGNCRNAIELQHPHVSVSEDAFDFEECIQLGQPVQKSLTLTNHTRGKIMVVWTRGNQDSCSFRVEPTMVEIPPLKGASVRVTFTPDHHNKVFGSELEAFCMYTTQLDFQRVDDATIQPASFLTIQCAAHSFLPSHHRFLPQYTLEPRECTLRGAHADMTEHKTVLWENTGTNPLLFRMTGHSKFFSPQPCFGVIQPGQRRVLVLQMAAVKEHKIYDEVIEFELNANPDYKAKLTCFGSSDDAQLEVENEGGIHFKPTAVGSRSVRCVTVRNLSRMPVRYEWKVSSDDKKTVSVEPSVGTVLPNDKLVAKWTFAPLTEADYVIKVSLVGSVEGAPQQRSVWSCRLIGKGTLGSIKALQDSIDLGHVLVGSRVNGTIVLANDGECDMTCALSVDQTLILQNSTVVKDDTASLSLERRAVTIPARSKSVVGFAVCPTRRALHRFSVSQEVVWLVDGQDGVVTHRKQEHVCEIVADGVYPSLAVTDARGLGSLKPIGKRQLWQGLSLHQLNTYLSADPSAEELQFTATERRCTRGQSMSDTRAVLDVNMGAAPLGSVEADVKLLVENTGPVPCEMWFLLPRDLEIDMEYWADSGELTQDELEQFRVCESELFSIEPRHSVLPVGGSVCVTCTYRHSLLGVNRLPVLLKLRNSRELLLNLAGVTIEPHRGYLHLASSEHVFAPVAVGSQHPPVQTYELFNAGSEPVKFELDLDGLDLLQRDNFEHRVFECLTRVGCIDPGQTFATHWRFSPLENRTYAIEVAIRTDYGDVYPITFTGIGFDSRAMGNTMPTLASVEQHPIDVPGMQSIPEPKQIGFLSVDRVSLGNVPLFSKSRRTLFLRNSSSGDAMRFEWHVTSPLDRQFVSVVPSRGRVLPRSEVMLKVTFIALGLPAFHDLDLVCSLHMERDLARHELELSTWLEEEERQKHEFTISDASPGQGLRASLESPPRSSVVAEGKLHKFKTLPAIRRDDSPTDNVTRQATDRRRRQADSQSWKKPSAPKPFLLHLGITARTHETSEYRHVFAEYPSFYIDAFYTHLSPHDSDAARDEAPADELECTQEESDTVTATMSSIIRSLVEDTSFSAALDLLRQEKVPFYTQLPNAITAGHAPAEHERACAQAVCAQAQTKESGPCAPCAPDEKGAAPCPYQATDSTRQTREANLRVKTIPEFGHLLEEIMTSAMANILNESACAEFDITARPRLIALLPKSNAK